MHGEGNIKIKGYIISLILDNGYINIFFWRGGGVYMKKKCTVSLSNYKPS